MMCQRLFSVMKSFEGLAIATGPSRGWNSRRCVVSNGGRMERRVTAVTLCLQLLCFLCVLL